MKIMDTKRRRKEETAKKKRRIWKRKTFLLLETMRSDKQEWIKKRK
jgi:hypothetical protein